METFSFGAEDLNYFGWGLIDETVCDRGGGERDEVAACLWRRMSDINGCRCGKQLTAFTHSAMFTGASP